MPSATIVGPRRDLPPLRQLIVDSPIIASPPIPPRAETRLARPIDAITAELSEGVLMYEVTTSTVISPWIIPAIARRRPCSRMGR